MAKNKQPDLDLDDLDGALDTLDSPADAPASEPPTAAADVPAVAKDLDGVPYCVRHHCRMTQYSGRTKSNPKAYYKCPVPDCKETAKLVSHGRRAVPSAPLICPACFNRGESRYMERDSAHSTVSSVVLRCPHCQDRVGPLAMPNQAAVHQFEQRRAGVREIGER